MDISFTCSDCNTALEIDSSMSGSQIACPNCGTVLTVPAVAVTSAPTALPIPEPVESSATRGVGFGRKLNAAEIQAPPTASIAKGRSALEVQAKAGVRMHVKTFRRADCMAGGKDAFDDTVSKFIHGLAEGYFISAQPIHYSLVDKATQQVLQDYGVMIVYRH